MQRYQPLNRSLAIAIVARLFLGAEVERTVETVVAGPAIRVAATTSLEEVTCPERIGDNAATLTTRTTFLTEDEGRFHRDKLAGTSSRGRILLRFQVLQLTG